jgi:hypothetical protein
MAKTREDGHEYTSANGYRYRRVQGRYRLVHHIIAEEQLGRPLLPTEGVRFKDSDRTNLDPKNIEVRIKGGGRVRARLAAVQERIRELQAEERILLEQLGE